MCDSVNEVCPDCAAYPWPDEPATLLPAVPDLPPPIEQHDRCGAVVRISCVPVAELVEALGCRWGYVKTYSVTRHIGRDLETQVLIFGPEGRSEHVQCLIPAEKLFAVDALRRVPLRKRVLRKAFPLLSDLHLLLWNEPLLTFREWQSRWLAKKHKG